MQNGIYSIITISIPYGAIKSYVIPFNHRKIDHISIPYGAIKRFYVSKDI